MSQNGKNEVEDLAVRPDDNQPDVFHHQFSVPLYYCSRPTEAQRKVLTPGQVSTLEQCNMFMLSPEHLEFFGLLLREDGPSLCATLETMISNYTHHNGDYLEGRDIGRLINLLRVLRWDTQFIPNDFYDPLQDA